MIDKVKQAARQKRYYAKKRAERQFIGIDGWGVDDAAGNHRYVLLCASTGDYVYAADGLTFLQVAQFLKRLRNNHPTGILVGFGLNYDVNCWLYSFGLDFIVERILDRDPEVDKGFTYVPGIGKCWLDWKPGKQFLCNLAGTGCAIYDVFGFFQSPFARACRDYGIGQQDTLFRIEEMKRLRAEFGRYDMAVMRDYCITECKYLAELMGKVKDLCSRLEIYPRSWSGAGALANELLRSNNVKQHIFSNEGANLPEVYAAFYGGRFEALQLGEIAQAFSHDIHSAYPAAMAQLPCLRCAHFDDITVSAWRQAQEDGELYALCHVTWELPEGTILGPFPWRSIDGTVLYPASGEGWYWSPEVVAALVRYPRSAYIHVLAVKRLVTSTDCSCNGHPFDWIAGTYAQRAELKEAGDMRERVLKLALAACFGKFCQGVGSPAWQCMIWAGLITSITRAKLLDVVWRNDAEHQVLLIATDGIYSRTPLDVPMGDGLGQWDGGLVTDLFIVGSGLLRLHCSACSGPECEKCHGTGYITKSRGFSTGERIPWARLIEKFRKNLFTAQVNVPLHRFVGAQLARHLIDKSLWGKWVTGVESEMEVMVNDAATMRNFSTIRVQASGRVPVGSSDGLSIQTEALDGIEGVQRPHRIYNLREPIKTEEELSLVIDAELSSD